MHYMIKGKLKYENRIDQIQIEIFVLLVHCLILGIGVSDLTANFKRT